MNNPYGLVIGPDRALSRPHGLLVGPDGVLYVGDSQAHRIRVVQSV